MNTSPNNSPVTYTDVSRETCDFVFAIYERNRDAFTTLIKRWLWWNRNVNLFSRNISAEELKNHILHSLFLMAPGKNTACQNIIDAGTGGGLPGLPLAIIYPHTDFLLIDKSQKKIHAVKDLIRGSLIKNADAICTDIHGFYFSRSCNIVSKHAFHIPALLSYSKNIYWKEIRMLKGDDLFSELTVDILDRYVVDIVKLTIKSNSFFQNKFLLRIINNQ